MKNFNRLFKKTRAEFRNTILFAVVAALIGSYFFCHYVGGTVTEYDLLVHGSAAQGTVINCAEILDEDGERGAFASRYCNYRFTVNNTSIESKSEGFPLSTITGSTIEVLYLPSEPETNILKQPSPGAGWFVAKTLKIAGIFVACFFVSFWYIISAARKYTRFHSEIAELKKRI